GGQRDRQANPGSSGADTPGRSQRRRHKGWHGVSRALNARYIGRSRCCVADEALTPDSQSTIPQSSSRGDPRGFIKLIPSRSFRRRTAHLTVSAHRGQWRSNGWADASRVSVSLTTKTLYALFSTVALAWQQRLGAAHPRA